MDTFNYLFPLILLSFAAGMTIGVFLVTYWRSKDKNNEPTKSD